MDFPIFHLDFMGNRLLIAVIAILHVLINHALAVGFIPVVTLLEYRGFRERKSNPQSAMHWDELARKMMFVGFVITTSIGALTGVGIWFSASLVNPDAIGSLIRVFYSAWFSEWIIFMLEIVFIMVFFLGWKKANESAGTKKRHILFGAGLSVFSWLTMVIIVAILSFMMDPGNWLSNRSFFSGVANPLYIPQLYFRTPLAMMMGGAFALFLTMIFLKKGNPVREKATSFISLWVLVWTPVMAVGALLYRTAIPAAMMGNLPTAIGTMAFSQWYDSLLVIILAAVLVSVLIALWGFLKPGRLPRAALVIPIIVMCIFLGTFERVREFVRKPFVIGEYMYANGLRVEDYPLYKKNGILAYATYVSTPRVTEENKLEAGKNVFMIACSRCHTVTGINSVVRKFRQRIPPGVPGEPGKRLSEEAIKNYISKMHRVWYYMPPFPGNEAELDALVAFILRMDKNPRYIPGAQNQGVTISPAHSREPDLKNTDNKGS
ncbi:MAG: c-type cytochrome [Candidatus Aminicenantes bacterium]|nr:MAG: c-type cytochrome [Candidatus Aminicenantes bacterium]